MTLERQTTTRRRLVLRAYWASNPICCSRERTPTFATTQKEGQHPQSLPRGGGEDERLVLTDSPVTTRTRSRTQRQMVQLTLTQEHKKRLDVNVAKYARTNED